MAYLRYIQLKIKVRLVGGFLFIAINAVNGNSRFIIDKIKE